MPLIYYPASALVNALASTIVFILAIVKNPRSQLNRSFGYFAFSVAFWAYGYFMWQISDQAEYALFWCRILMAGAIFIPSTFLHFSIIFVDRRDEYLNVIRFWYFVSFLFLLFSFTPFFVYGVEPRLGFAYWPVPGFMYTPFLLVFIGLTIYAHVLMYQRYNKLSGFERNRIKYVFLGTAIGFLGGSTNYLLWYNIPVPPIGNALVTVYVIMVAYATVKYRLMDITVFTIRGITFAIVYCLVLGIPFWFGFKFLGSGLWIIPVSMMALFATVGPFLYNYIRRRAEGVVMKEQLRYQQTLLQVSRSMTLIKELDKLLKLIVHVVTRTIKIKNASLFLLDKETNQYSLKAIRYKDPVIQNIFFETEDEITKFLVSKKTSIVYEELKTSLQHDHQTKENGSHAILAKMEELEIAVIVPSFVQELLIGFLVLGEKQDGKMYTHDDLNVFGVLANQAALAIENAVFYQEQGKTLAEKFHEHKVWSIGKMGAGVGHQINNRFCTIRAAAEVIAVKYIPKLKQAIASSGGGQSDEAGDIFGRIESSLGIVTDDSIRGGEIATSLTHFSRKSTDFKAVSIEDAIKGALNLLSCKFKVELLNLSKDVPKEPANVLGNLSILQDIFMNMLDNTHDAQDDKREMIKKGEIPYEGEYQPQTVIKIQPDPMRDSWIIEVSDNGIGMTEEQLSQMFIPFFTTKATSEKGTGLGMSMIKQMIDAHKGTIKLESKYGIGTKTTLTFPCAKE